MSEENEKVNHLRSGLSEDNLAFFKFLQMEDTPYFSAVGHFISDYAGAEAAFHILARSLSGLEDVKARAVFGGMRLEDLVDRIRAMLRLNAVSNENNKMIEECIAQLNKIGGIRHRIVHRSIEIKQAEIHVSNLHTSKSLQIQNESFSIKDLDKMANDCRKIFAKLVFFVFPDALRSVSEDVVDTWLNGPWQYKPVPPKNEGQSKTHKKKELRPQPPSLPE